MDGYYGEAPVDLGPLDLSGWQEFMHYLYLPVRIPARDGGRVGLGIDCDAHKPADLAQYAVPERLWFLGWVLHDVVRDARAHAPHLDDPYVYITARRGYATPGNPLNRPGWHCDDFGGTDLNYVWSDRWPTRLLLSGNAALPIGLDDRQSMEDMQGWADTAERGEYLGHPMQVRIEDAPAGHLLRLTPYVIHDTPLIPEPGGMRSFFKVSVSSHRYNLLGNSHNHLLDYEWTMYDRAVVRNQPQGNGDYVIERAADA